MTSLPVKKCYQKIGQIIEAEVDAVVHIENSVYIRSLAITSDSESLSAFLDYAISRLGQGFGAEYDLQIKQNNLGISYG